MRIAVDQHHLHASDGRNSTPAALSASSASLASMCSSAVGSASGRGVGTAISLARPSRERSSTLRLCELALPGAHAHRHALRRVAVGSELDRDRGLVLGGRVRQRACSAVKYRLRRAGVDADALEHDRERPRTRTSSGAARCAWRSRSAPACAASCVARPELLQPRASSRRARSVPRIATLWQAIEFGRARARRSLRAAQQHPRAQRPPRSTRPPSLRAAKRSHVWRCPTARVRAACRCPLAHHRQRVVDHDHRAGDAAVAEAQARGGVGRGQRRAAARSTIAMRSNRSSRSVRPRLRRLCASALRSSANVGQRHGLGRSRRRMRCASHGKPAASQAEQRERRL